MNINARSIINKFPSFLSVVSSYEPHVIGITETWLSEDVHDSEFTPPGYIAVRGDREHGRGGGVALLFRADLKFSVLPAPVQTESLFCKLYLDGRTFVIAVFYRPPGSSVELLHNVLQHIYDHSLFSSEFIFMGDFNAPGIRWPALTYSARDSCVSREIINFSLAFDLTQIVREFTREQAILDLVFLSSSIIERGYKYEIIDGISDHRAVIVYLNSSVSKARFSFTTFPDISNADDVSITDYLSDNFDAFNELAATSEVDLLVDRFEHIVKTCIRRFIPLKTKKKNARIPWISRDILHLSRRVSRLRRKRRLNKPESISRFNEAKEELRTKTSTAKDFFFRVELKNLLANNPRKFWSSVLPRDSSSTSIIVGSEATNDPVTIANAFNSYFQSVFSCDSNAGPPFTALKHSSITNINISEDGVLNLVLNLNVKKSAGPDGIPNQFLVRYALWMSQYLTIIFRKSLATGVVPKSWKRAKIIPLFKSGDKQLLNNYRPISLTPYSCKLLEHIIHKHIMEFLEENNILTNAQHGF